MPFVRSGLSWLASDICLSQRLAASPPVTALTIRTVALCASARATLQNGAYVALFRGDPRVRRELTRAGLHTREHSGTARRATSGCPNRQDRWLTIQVLVLSAL